MKRLKTALISFILTLVFLPGGWCRENSANNEIRPGEIVVTSTMTEKEAKDAPGSVEIIDFEEIKEIGADTVAEALEEASGLMMKTESGRVKTPDVRGSGSNHALILIDGMRTAPGFRNVLDLNHIPVEMVERIEIIRGASSALYGSDALGGIINIITRKPEKEFSAGAGFKYSQDKHVDGHKTRYGAYASDTVDRIGYFVSASTQRRNNYDYDNISPDDGDKLDSVAVQGSVNFKINEKNSLKAGYEYSNNESDGIRDFQGKDRLRESDDKRLGYHLSYGFQNNENLTASLFLNHSEYENNIEMTPEAGDFNETTNEVDEAGFRLTSSHFDKHILTAGSDFRKSTRTEKNLREDDSDNFGIFCQDEIMLFNKFYLVGGIRYDDHSEAGDFYAPRTSFVYKPVGGLRLKASWGKGFKAPGLDELFSTSYKKRGREVYEPNKNLSPEESSSWEMGIEGEYKRFSAGFVYFKAYIDELIFPKYYKSTGKGKKKIDYYRYENMENAEAEGCEANASLKLFSGLICSCRLSYADNKDQDTSDYTKAQIKLSQKIDRYSLTWNIRGNYTGRMKDGSGDDLEDYTTWHVNLSKKINRYIKITGGIDNLFNEESDEHIIDPATYYCGVSFKY